MDDVSPLSPTYREADHRLVPALANVRQAERDYGSGNLASSFVKGFVIGTAAYGSVAILGRGLR